MPDDTQQTIPGTQPAATSAAPAPTPDVSKLVAAVEASSKETASLKAALATTQAQLKERDDPKWLLSKFSALMGTPAEKDPKELLTEANTKAQASAAEADKWKKHGLGAVVQRDATLALVNAKVKNERLGAALRLLDTGGIEIDDANMSVKDKATLEARIAAVKAESPEWFTDHVSAAPPQNNVTPIKPSIPGFSIPKQDGAPLPGGQQPDGKQAPAPGDNGAPGVWSLDQSNFLESLGIAPSNNIPLSQVRAVKAG